MSKLLSRIDGPGSLSSGEGSEAAWAAHEFLTGLDGPIANLALQHGPIDFTLPSHDTIPADHVGLLTLSIIGQMISVKAAIAIYGRLGEMLGGRIDPEGLADATEDHLRAVGLSYAKAKTVRELGTELATGRFSFEAIATMSDDDAQARLVALRGIGPWSAQMFLLRSMGRPDIFPAGDLGLRRSIQLIDTLNRMPSVPDAARRYAFRGCRSDWPGSCLA
jgi:DNA-3-methyladenine glycosylase II